MKRENVSVWLEVGKAWEVVLYILVEVRVSTVSVNRKHIIQGHKLFNLDISDYSNPVAVSIFSGDEELLADSLDRLNFFSRSFPVTASCRKEQHIIADEP